MDTPNTQKNDLEVTGVSRSGRVRKKSSKLMDFQSPDDIETRHKKTASKQKQFHMNTSATSQQNQQQQQSSTPTGSRSSDSNFYSPTDMKSDDDQLSSIDDFLSAENDESFGSDIDIDDSAIIDEELLGDDANELTDIDPTVRRSIYMSEKVNKKKVLKDGKVVHTKTQRKDKGKTRFTAYMLWAREARKQMLVQQPDLDFATISRRLGEMWSNVPISEKCIWKRKVKRLANCLVKQNKNAGTMKSPSKFLNKGANASNKTKNVQSQLEINQQSQPHQKQQDDVDINGCKMINLAAPQSQSSKTGTIISPGTYKVTGIEPLDVAAHLKLLGDSLTIIGERLKEHEGQITVSGSLSVLLDSLLCAMGPLMCLTAQIRGLNENNNHLKESLRNTLDNIAYVMPGL